VARIEHERPTDGRAACRERQHANGKYENRDYGFDESIARVTCGLFHRAKETEVAPDPISLYWRRESKYIGDMTITDFSYSGSELDAVAEATNYYRWIIDAFSKHIGAATVEAGAGIGTVSELILAKNEVRDLLLIEPAGNNVPALRARFAGDARVRVHHGYLEDLAPTLHADTLIAVNVLEHVERDVEFLRAGYTGLVPGGKLLMLVPALPAIFGSLDRAFDHYRRYTRTALRSAVRGAGFEIDELHYLNGIGVAAWFMAGRVLGRTTLGRRQVRFYDRFVIPWLSRAEKIVHPPIGQSLFLIAHKPDEPTHGGR
jgi:SAM-dependent methyltransferase